MARTKASVGAKISSGKSSKARCSVAPSTSSNGSSGSTSSARAQAGGGNPMCPRETPKWQKPITNFFIGKDTRDEASDVEDDQPAAGSSKTRSKKNIIESDDENEKVPTNNELDETLHLEPLDGEDSHKLEEYYPKHSKGKGMGKKSKFNKENIVTSERRSSKRDYEDTAFEDESDRVSKKVKVN